MERPSLILSPPHSCGVLQSWFKGIEHWMVVGLGPEYFCIWPKPIGPGLVSPKAMLLCLSLWRRSLWGMYDGVAYRGCAKCHQFTPEPQTCKTKDKMHVGAASDYPSLNAYAPMALFSYLWQVMIKVTRRTTYTWVVVLPKSIPRPTILRLMAYYWFHLPFCYAFIPN